MPNTSYKRTRLAIAAESTFGTDPDPTGAAYLWTRLLDLQLIRDERVVLPTNYFVGRNADTPHEMGNDLAGINIKVPMLPMATDAGAGQSVVADDWFDLLMNCAFGTNVGEGGIQVTSSTSTTVTTSTSTFGIQDLMPVRDPTISPNGIAGSVQWRRTSSASSPYTVHENWTVNPTSSAVVMGTKRWGPLLDPGGATLSACYDLDFPNGQAYTASGGRINTAKLMLAAGQMATFDLGIRFDNLNPRGALPASLPALTTWVNTPIKGQLCLAEWGGTLFQFKTAEVDFKPTSSDNESCQGANGRANIDNTRMDPEVTVTPLFATSFEADFRAGTQRNLLVRYGSGVAAGGACYTIALWFENAQILSHGLQNDGNRVRQQIKFGSKDPGIFVGTTAGRLWQLARC